MTGPWRPISSRGGRRSHAARPCLAALFAVALAAVPGAAAAQGMLRGSLDALPGADDDFSPYALGPASDTAFGAAPEDAPADPYSDTPPPLPDREPGERRANPVEEEPYEQLGIRAGAFLVKPSVTLLGGYDSNPEGGDPPEGSSYGRAEARIDLESDWIRHEFRGRVEAGYEAYEEFPENNAPDFAADAALRLDVREDIRVDAAVRGALDTDTRDDPELIGVTSTDENLRLGASLGMVYKPGRVSFAPALEAARTDYGDPSLDDRDYNEYEARLRTGFELSPALEPFLEVSGNERIYDEPVNDSGVEHDSRGYRVYAGARFDPDPVWTAELKLGYGEQKAEDPFVPAQSGLVGEATLIWEPSALTSLRLSGGRDFEATTVECCAVADVWFARAGFEHRFREWLILTGETGYRNAFHPNIDYRLANIHADMELEYKFNRTLSALGRLEYRRLDSSDDDQDYDATIVSVGLRLQR